jgi:hypothetical protein
VRPPAGSAAKLADATTVPTDDSAKPLIATAPNSFRLVMRDVPYGVIFEHSHSLRPRGLRRTMLCVIEAVGLMRPVNQVEATRTFMIKFLVGLIMISGVSPWSVTEPTAKSSIEISIVTKAAGVGDLADGLACFEKRPTL